MMNSGASAHLVYIPFYDRRAHNLWHCAPDVCMFFQPIMIPEMPFKNDEKYGKVGRTFPDFDS